MTSPPEYPTRAPGERVPSARQVCPRCGAVVVDSVLHQRWHKAIEDRVENLRTQLASGGL